MNAETPSDLGARLKELAKLFLRLGTTAFGGPAAHIAMMEDEVVHRRGWMSREHFLDLLGATNLIPGPNSTEMAIHIGHQRAGWRGLLVAGSCFIAPAVLIVMGFAWAYVSYGSLPQVAGLLYGVKPIIIAVVLQALWNLSKSAVKSTEIAVAGLGALAMAFLGANEVLVMLIAGAFVAAMRTSWTKPRGGVALFAGGSLLAASQGTAATAAAVSVPYSSSLLFWFFLKIGSVLYGSGYVLLAFLRSGLVEKWGWLSSGQLLDAVAVGQVTPGPVFTTATFIGYVLGGPRSALLATLGIFIPSFVFVAISAPLVPKLRNSKLAGAVLDGVNVASLALMTYVTWQLGRSALVDPLTFALAAAGAILLVRYKVNSTWLVALGAVAGLLHATLG